jgi:signal transduction histidine kinase
MNDADVNAANEPVRRALLTERMAAVGTLAEALSHELYNPLNCALLQLAVLQRRLAQPDCQPASLQPVAELVEQALRRLELLFNDLLSLVQPGSGDDRVSLPLANLWAGFTKATSGDGKVVLGARQPDPPA